MCFPICYKCKRRIPDRILRLPAKKWFCPVCNIQWARKPKKPKGEKLNESQN